MPKTMPEAALDAEMSEHPGYDKHNPSGATAAGSGTMWTPAMGTCSCLC